MVGGEDLLHRLVFGEYQYECKGDHKSDRYVVMIIFISYKILNTFNSLYSHPTQIEYCIQMAFQVSIIY